MNANEFKKKYLTDSFYFVENESEFINLQEIGIAFGIKNPIGDFSLIGYDTNRTKNLTFFPSGKFQQSAFWGRGYSYSDPIKPSECINAFNSLRNSND